jgi:hypothetical protein
MQEARDAEERRAKGFTEVHSSDMTSDSDEGAE